MMLSIVGRLLAGLSKLINSKAGGWIASILLFFGISITSYHFGVAPFRDMMSQWMGGAGFLLNWIGYFRIDQAMTITLSAIGAKYAVGGARAILTKGS